MKRAKTSSLLLFLVLCLVVLAAFSTIEARKHHGKKIKMHKHKKNKNGDASSLAPAPAPLPDSGASKSFVFNILSFGARANGVSDDSKALLKAWKLACKVGGIVEIPAGHEFLIKPLTLQGPCRPNLVLQIDGTLLAPPKIGSWPKSSLYQWMNFKWVQNFTIQGGGTVDGQGSNWWASSQPNQKKRAKKIPDIKPTALRFYKSYDITVVDIKIINSPLCHLKFDNSKGVKVQNVTISAPENSPNTDGIHLQNSQDVEILQSDIGTGDDCVSIQRGCSNIHVHHINCGPGHGISLGGLGKDRQVACVWDVVVESIAMMGTMYGARIKTWQGGQGSVKNVTFSDIQVTDVKVPITIDQYYCDKSVCKNETGAVAISGVRFHGIKGTYAVQPIHLACSTSIPCVDLHLVALDLHPSPNFNAFQHPLCSNSYGNSLGPLAPPSIDYCVRGGNDVVRRISRSHDVACW